MQCLHRRAGGAGAQELQHLLQSSVEKSDGGKVMQSLVANEGTGRLGVGVRSQVVHTVSSLKGLFSCLSRCLQETLGINVQCRMLLSLLPYTGK